LTLLDHGGGIPVRLIDHPAVLLQDPKRLFAVSLGGIDRVLDRFLAPFDRRDDRSPRLPREDGEKNEEGDDRPESEPEVDPDQWIVHALPSGAFSLLQDD